MEEPRAAVGSGKGLGGEAGGQQREDAGVGERAVEQGASGEQQAADQQQDHPGEDEGGEGEGSKEQDRARILIINITMKALVGIKRVVDYTAQKIKIKNDQVDLANTRMYINPFCEIAMQEAANLKAKKAIKEIVALSIGPKGEKKILWTPLALGADKAIYVNSDLRHDTDLQPILVAQTLKHFVEREGIELVILGKQCTQPLIQLSTMIVTLLGKCWPACSDGPRRLSLLMWR